MRTARASRFLRFLCIRRQPSPIAPSERLILNRLYVTYALIDPRSPHMGICSNALAQTHKHTPEHTHTHGYSPAAFTDQGNTRPTWAACYAYDCSQRFLCPQREAENQVPMREDRSCTPTTSSRISRNRLTRCARLMVHTRLRYACVSGSERVSVG